MSRFCSQRLLILIWTLGLSFPSVVLSAANTQEATQNSNQALLQLNAVKPNRDTNLENQYDPQHLFSKPNMYEKQSFQSVARQAMPLTPAQIMQLKKMLAVTQHASSASADIPPTPTLSTQEVSLSPGALPPVVRLQQGFVTSVVFLDSTGADWPIESYDLGNDRAFNVQWQQGTNVLMIQAMSMYNYGNLAVKLEGLTTPVMLTLVPGQRLVDYRIDLRVDGQGPNAQPTYSNNGTHPSDGVLLNVLDGIAPTDGKVLQVTGGRCRAWAVGNKMYLRTQLDVLSPSWISIMSSPDGTKAYLMVKSPTVLVSENGNPVALKLEDE